jgi:putative colanic acid biosynthesis acetyltransferase WcaF
VRKLVREAASGKIRMVKDESLSSESPRVASQSPRIFQTLDKTAAYPYRRNEYLRRILWSIVQATLFRFSPSRLLGWRRFLLKCFGAKIGPHSGVRPGAKIFHPWLFEMGDWSMLAGGVVIYNLGVVRIGDHTVLSQDVYVCAGTHDYTQPNLPLERPPITIGSGAWIAAGAFIGPGVSIGDNTVVGARAVVMSDVESGVVVAGNPATLIKQRTMT